MTYTGDATKGQRSSFHQTGKKKLYPDQHHKAYTKKLNKVSFIKSLNLELGTTFHSDPFLVVVPSSFAIKILNALMASLGYRAVTEGLTIK